MSQTGDVENLVSFNGSSRNLRQNSVTPQQLQEVLRDTKPLSKRTLSSDHVVTSVQQTLDTKNQEKRGKKLFLHSYWSGCSLVRNTQNLIQVLCTIKPLPL